MSFVVLGYDLDGRRQTQAGRWGGKRRDSLSQPMRALEDDNDRFDQQAALQNDRNQARRTRREPAILLAVSIPVANAFCVGLVVIIMIIIMLKILVCTSNR
ncbi:hypothetical protein CHARACLAT_003526 [Characodon lateralis]|uniref:Uncharacterized protein n=1 Tax=Characodon lateralis TaxID=208331 RepID=A0ABU7E704_9TELE|nr:hypothetical protein [Characodon lateralis]